MKRFENGLTLIEVLIATLIVIMILAASYLTYTNLLSGFKEETSNVGVQIESLIGTEILRLDIEHLGYGIAEEETALIINVLTDSNDNPILNIRSTLNNTDSTTRGWLITICDSSSNLQIQVDSRENTSNNYVVILNSVDKKYFDAGTISGSSIIPQIETCNPGDIYLAFPIEFQDNNGDGINDVNACNIGICNLISYALSQENLIDRCNSNTFNLVRRTGLDAINGSGGSPVLNCVADWEVTFDIDNNGDGKIDVYDSTSVFTTNAAIKTQLKRVNVYILIQEGNKDINYTFSNYIDCSSITGTKCVKIGSVELKLPDNYSNYRWKAIKLSVKPTNVR